MGEIKLNIDETILKDLNTKQKYFNDMGLVLIRIKEALEGNDCILYDIKKRSYNEYSINKMSQILSNMFKIREIILFDPLYEEEKSVAINLKNFIVNNSFLVDNITFIPKDELIVKIDDKIYFNIYKKSYFMEVSDKKEVIEPKTEQFLNISKILLHNCVNDEGLYNYCLKWYAWKVQNPENKLPTALVFNGEKGTGKSLFQEYVVKTIWGHLFGFLNQEDLDSQYNGFMMGKLILAVEEAINPESRGKISQKLKSFISDKTVNIQQKFKISLNVGNYVSLTFNSNIDKAVDVEENDRRYTFVGFQKQKIDYTLVQDFLANYEKECHYFYWYLKKLKVDYKDVYYPFRNKVKIDIENSNFNSIQEMLKEWVIYEDIDTFANNYVLDFHKKHIIQNKKGTVYVRTKGFYECYSKFCLETGHKPYNRSRFVIELKKKGFSEEVVWDSLSEISTRGIEINKESLILLKKQYNEHIKRDEKQNDN